MARNGTLDRVWCAVSFFLWLPATSVTRYFASARFQISRFGSGRTHPAAHADKFRLTGVQAHCCGQPRGGMGSRISRSASLMFFLNSLMPFLIDAPISGTRLAPKSTRTMTRMTIRPSETNVAEIHNRLLEERTCDEVGDDNAVTRLSRGYVEGETQLELHQN